MVNHIDILVFQEFLYIFVDVGPWIILKECDATEFLEFFPQFGDRLLDGVLVACCIDSLSTKKQLVVAG